MICLIEYIAVYRELLGFAAAGLGALSFLPQVIKIWKSRSAKDVSAGMYVIYTVSLILWLAYGIIINSPPIIIAQTTTLVFVSAILIMKYLWK